MWLLQRGFAKNRVLNVDFGWCDSGGLLAKRGLLAATLSPKKTRQKVKIILPTLALKLHLSEPHIWFLPTKPGPGGSQSGRAMNYRGWRGVAGPWGGLKESGPVGVLPPLVTMSTGPAGTEVQFKSIGTI
jgi:hypothetical protein